MDETGRTDKTQSHDDILQAAADLFSEHGFNGTSFAAVAKAAQHSKALVQYHFASKEKLWKSSVQYVWEKRTNALPKYLDEGVLNQLHPDEQNQMIRQLCKGLIRFTFDNPHWVKIMYLEAAAPGPRLDWMVDTFLKQDVEQGYALIELAQKRQLLPAADPMSLLYILGGTVIHYVNVAPIKAKVLKVDPYSYQQIDHYVDNFIRILEQPSQH